MEKFIQVYIQPPTTEQKAALCEELFGDEFGVGEKAYSMLWQLGLIPWGFNSRIKAIDDRFYLKGKGE